MKSCERIVFILGNYGRKWVQDFDLEGTAYRFLAGLLGVNSKFPDRIFQMPDVSAFKEECYMDSYME